jgi:hypothetical protein
MSSELPPPTLEVSSLKLIPRIVHSTLLGLFGPTWVAHSGFPFFRVVQGPRIAYRTPGRPWAALGAFPLRLVGCCRKRRINIGDPDVTIEKPAMGAEEKFSYLFFPTRGKMRLRGKVYQSIGTGNRWRPIVDRFGCGASFSSIMRSFEKTGVRADVRGIARRGPLPALAGAVPPNGPRPPDGLDRTPGGHLPAVGHLPAPTSPCSCNTKLWRPVRSRGWLTTAR